MDNNISKKTGKPKRALTEKQKEALAKGRAKRAENLANGITKSKPGVKNTADYLTGLVHGIEMDRRIVKRELDPYNKALDRLDGEFGVDVVDITDPKVKQYIKRNLTPKQMEALAKGREKRRQK